MFIQTELTPNPATIKFLPGQTVMLSGSANFAGKAEADSSPLALRLFEIEGVAGVFLGSDFVSVSKAPAADWHGLKPRILAALMEHFTTGQPVMHAAAEDTAVDDSDPVIVQIKELIATRVRPAVMQDGGDIVFNRFEDGVVFLEMRGACSGCPSSTATLKTGIENMLRHFVPEVIEVRQTQA
jgi:Fe-S cluster biogenesis protein NfuA